MRRKKHVNSKLFQNLNSYHKNITVNLEENPRKFLDAEIIRKNNTISTQVFTKLTKFPVHLSSKSQLIIKVTLLPVNYIEQKKPKKQQGFKELRRIKTKFLHAGYPSKFINDTFF